MTFPKSDISMLTLCISWFLNSWNKWSFSNFGPKELTESPLIKPPGKEKKWGPGGDLSATFNSSASSTSLKCSRLEPCISASKNWSRPPTRSPWSACAGCWQRSARTWNWRPAIGLAKPPRRTKQRKWFVYNLMFDIKGRFWLNLRRSYSSKRVLGLCIVRCQIHRPI